MESLEATVACAETEDREKFFEGLYENAFPRFARFAGKMNASFQDAKDIFHDAMVIYYEKSLDASFSVERSPEAYVVGVARHLWLRKFNREKHHSSLTHEDVLYAVADIDEPDKNEQRLLHVLGKAGRKCMDLLSEFYFGKRSLKELASMFGYRTEHSVAVQKYKCIGKLRNVVKSKSIHYEDLHY